jgi:hypothetical protein
VVWHYLVVYQRTLYGIRLKRKDQEPSRILGIKGISQRNPHYVNIALTTYYILRRTLWSIPLCTFRGLWLYIEGHRASARIGGRRIAAFPRDIVETMRGQGRQDPKPSINFGLISPIPSIIQFLAELVLYRVLHLERTERHSKTGKTMASWGIHTGRVCVG